MQQGVKLGEDLQYLLQDALRHNLRDNATRWD